MVSFLKFCQLSISYEIYSYLLYIYVADEKLFLKAWSIE